MSCYTAALAEFWGTSEMLVDYRTVRMECDAYAMCIRDHGQDHELSLYLDQPLPLMCELDIEAANCITWLMFLDNQL